MSYSELLKSPKWQKKRLEILSRDNWTCTECGDDENTLHVHHTEYRKGKKPWEYPKKCLKTLCEECHKSKNSEEAKHIERTKKILNNDRGRIYNFGLLDDCRAYMYNFIILLYTSKPRSMKMSQGKEILDKLLEELKIEIRFKK